jgi:type II secretory pathway pseudopilin PulG
MRGPDVVGQRGQTMLEAIVAIGIIATAVSSALTLVQGSIKAETEAQAAVIAANLGREGAEVVRALRDSNWLRGDAFDEGLEAASYDYTGIPVLDPATGVWSIDFAPDAITDADAVVYRQTAADGSAVIGLYRQSADQPPQTIATGFRRLLALNAICDDGAGGTTIVGSGAGCAGIGLGKVGIQVQVQLAWQLPGRTRTQTVEYLLYDWR